MPSPLSMSSTPNIPAPRSQLRLRPSLRLLKAKRSRWPPPAVHLHPKEARGPLRQCSAALALPSNREMTADAAALAIAAGRADDSAAEDARIAGAEDATAGPGAICRRPNTLRRRIHGRASRNPTSRLPPRISSPSFCRASRSPFSKIACRPLQRRLRLGVLRLPAELPPRCLRRARSRTRNCPRDCPDRSSQLRLPRLRSSTKFPLLKRRSSRTLPRSSTPFLRRRPNRKSRAGRRPRMARAFPRKM